MTLHGVGRSTALPVRVTLPATAARERHVLLRQTDYGMKPVSVAGVVKVKDEVSIEFTVVAVPAPRATPGPQRER